MTLHETLSVCLAAMLPYLELRGAIPLAFTFGASPIEAFAVSLGGNILPVIPIMIILPVLAKWADRVAWIDRFLCWLSRKVGRKQDQIKRYGPIGLAIFVAIPLPMTGAWTGAALAFLLGIRMRHAFPAIAAGVVIAGIIVTLLCTGIKVLT